MATRMRTSLGFTLLGFAFIAACEPLEIASTASALGSAPTITSVSIVGNPTSFQVGMRYAVRVHVLPGTDTAAWGVEADTSQAGLNLINGYNTAVRITQAVDFDFSFTPTQSGSYALVFRMRNGNVAVTGWTTPLQIEATSARTGLFGYVRDRFGNALAGASVHLDGLVGGTGSDGLYTFTLGAGTHTLTVTKAGYSETDVISIPFTQPGIRVDVVLQEQFTALTGSGISYKSWVDYSQGRTLFHVVTVTTSQAELAVEVPRTTGLGTARDVAGVLATINGGFFLPEVTPNPVVAQGYLYANGQAYAAVPITSYAVPAPLLTLAGDNYDIVDSVANSVNIPVTFDAAIQCGPWLVENGAIAPDSGGDLDKYWARTSVGLADGLVFFVVADGEGNPGSAGANQAQLASFYLNSLHATKAMMMDGGGSTQLALASSSGMRWVNTVTGEDSEYQGALGGAVFSFVSARKKCVPRTCAQLAACGPVDDGCGHPLVCTPSTCRLGTVCNGTYCVKCPTGNNCQPS